MRLSDLQNKNIIDITDGSFLGVVIDVDISVDTGNILKIYTYNKSRFKGFFTSKEEFTIKWSDIKKIGTDTILVDKRV